MSSVDRSAVDELWKVVVRPFIESDNERLGIDLRHGYYDDSSMAPEDAPAFLEHAWDVGCIE